MRLTIISPAAVEATGTAGRAAGLAKGGQALLDGGLRDGLAAAGATIDGVARPALPAPDLTSDPIVNLGRFNRLIADAVVAGNRAGAAPLLLGGTCSHLIGILAGLQRIYGPTARIGLIWFDAHGDFNTPRTTPSGMLGGMPVAVAAGLCHAPWRALAGQDVPLPTDRILFVDVRNLDPDEAALIHATDARIARFGPGGALDDIAAAVHDLAARVDHLYLHVDADVLDASLQPNHPTAEPGGPDLAATAAALHAVIATGKVRAFGLVSVNPEGPDGPVSLASGSALAREAVASWAARMANV